MDVPSPTFSYAAATPPAELPKTADEAVTYLRHRLPVWRLDLDSYADRPLGDPGIAAMLFFFDSIRDEASKVLGHSIPDCPTWTEYQNRVAEAWRAARAWGESKGEGEPGRHWSGATADAVRAILSLPLPSLPVPDPTVRRVSPK